MTIKSHHDPPLQWPHFLLILLLLFLAQSAQSPSPQLASNLIIGAPDVVARDFYMKDEDFVRIDQKLRMGGKLRGYEVEEVRKQFVFGFLYDVTYRNAIGDRLVYKVYVNFAQINIIEKSTQKLVVGGIFYTKSQIEQDEDLHQIDAKLRRESGPGFNLTGFQLWQVYRYPTPTKNIYTIMYATWGQGVGTWRELHFRVDFVFGDIKVVSAKFVPVNATTAFAYYKIDPIKLSERQKILQSEQSNQTLLPPQIQTFKTFNESLSYLLSQHPSTLSQYQLTNIIATTDPESVYQSILIFMLDIKTPSSRFSGEVRYDLITGKIWIGKLVVVGDGFGG